MTIALVQHGKSILPDLTLGAAPTPGNLILALVEWAAPTGDSTIVGFTPVHGYISMLSHNLGQQLLMRVAQPGDTATLGFTTHGGGSAGSTLYAEFSGVAVLDADATLTEQSGGHPQIALTPSAGPRLVIGALTLESWNNGPDAGWTQIDRYQHGLNFMGTDWCYQVVTADGLTAYTPGIATSGGAWCAEATSFAGASVDFTGTPLSGEAPLAVTFTPTESGFTATSWDWDFGDGTSHGTTASPTHAYTVSGTYTVTLSASDGLSTLTRTRTAYVVVDSKGIGVTVYGVNPPGDSITFLADLTGAFDRFIRPERNAVGSGGFKIRRDDPKATPTILAKGNLVKVTIPRIDPDPIFSFFIETQDTDLISSDEQGGEVISIAGKGGLNYFDWARWLSVSYVVPWWDAGWAGLVAGLPPAGAIGHLHLAAGTYRHFTLNSSGQVNYPASTFSVGGGGLDLWYDRRQVYRWEAGAPLAGASVTLVRVLDAGTYHGYLLHPFDSGITDVQATSVLGQHPEFGDIGASDVTQWWDSAWGTPPVGTVGRVHASAGSYTTYTVSGGKITAKTPGGLPTGGFNAWIDQIDQYPYASGTASGFLMHLSSGAFSGTWLHASDPGFRVWRASEPVVSLVPGKVLYRICEEVQNAARPSHPMPLLTYDFTDLVDSDGNDWTNTDSLAGITADIGESYLTTVGKILSTGVLDIEMGPDLDFHAWDERGRDLTGASFGTGVVRFAKGVNIAAALRREETDGPVPTFTQVVGNNAYALASLPDAASRVARETTTQASNDGDTALAALGLADLEGRLARSVAAGFAVLLGSDESAGLYLPGPPGSAHGSYWLGDIVTLHTGTGADDYDEAAVRVAAITLSETESGDLVAIAEVSSSLGAAEDAAFPGSSGSSGGGSIGSSGGGTSVTVTTPDLSAYQPLAEKGIAGGYADLDGSGLVPGAELPFATPSGGYGSAAAGTAATALRSDAVLPRPTEADLSLSNVTTANVTTARHGLAPVLPNDATKYLDGTGAYSVPAGASVWAPLMASDGAGNWSVVTDGLGNAIMVSE